MGSAQDGLTQSQYGVSSGRVNTESVRGQLRTG